MIIRMNIESLLLIYLRNPKRSFYAEVCSQGGHQVAPGTPKI